MDAEGQLSDFKIAHRVGMGGFSALRQVREGRNINTSTTGDNRPLLHWRPMASCSVSHRQAIINDDLNMLTDVPMNWAVRRNPLLPIWFMPF